MFLALLATLTLAWAGDPCPIPMQMHEYTPEWRDRSADLEALTTKLTMMGLNYRTKAAEVVLHEPVPNSGAAEAGLKDNDVIVKINGQFVRDQDHANELFDAAPISRPLQLQVLRGGMQRLDFEVVSRPVDPVLLGIVQAVETTVCRKIRIQELTEEQRAALTTGAFDDNRAFRCEDAHEALKPAFESGDIVMIRGGRRILLTMPGWTTRCVDVADHDGVEFSRDKLRLLMEDFAKPYIEDRHANP